MRADPVLESVQFVAAPLQRLLFLAGVRPVDIQRRLMIFKNLIRYL
jgi:hypothetical protein